MMHDKSISVLATGLHAGDFSSVELTRHFLIDRARVSGSPPADDFDTRHPRIVSTLLAGPKKYPMSGHCIRRL
jgi:hypothetical protein